MVQRQGDACDSPSTPTDIRIGDVVRGSETDLRLVECVDPRTNTYALQAMTVMRIGGVITLVALGGMILYLLRKERRRPQPSLA